jgi:2-hydroxychromene-2-carboxylate isomerase
MSQPVLDFFFEFASTYSYPAAMRIGALAEAAGVAVRWRPFLLGPIFKAMGLDNSPFNTYPPKGRYMWRDVERICIADGLLFQRPTEFPQNGLLAARLAHVGFDEGWGVAFCRSVYVAEFGEGRTISEEPLLRVLLQDIGLEPDAALARAGSDEIKARLRATTEEAQKIGVFGAPSFVTADGELFWGQDRMADAIAWAKRARHQ